MRVNSVILSAKAVPYHSTQAWMTSSDDVHPSAKSFHGFHLVYSNF